MKRYGHIVTCCAIFAIAISGGLSANTTKDSYQLPSDAQVIGYLLQSVTWYRHLYTERQVASDPGDLVFLNDNQALESQIVKLSFEFAKADAALAKTGTSPHDAPATLAAPASADLAHFIELKNQNDQLTQQTSEDIGKLNEKIASARKADRKKLKAALDDAQSRLELLQPVSQAVNDLIQFVQTARTAQANSATLDLTIDDLAQSIPELSSPATPLSKLPAQDSDSRTSNSWRETGLLGLASEVSALNRKLRVVDEKIRLTDNFSLSAKNMRTPMSDFITRVLQRAVTSNLPTSNLSLLREQKSQLDALTLELKAFSPAILALDKQKALLEEYESHLLPWRTAVAKQYRQAWNKLVVRLLIVVLIVGLLFGMGEISRRLALGRIEDPNRRRVTSMVHRFLTMFAIAVVALFSVASDLSSLATYFGLLSAGLLLALQNVILASLGSLVLLGKRGIRDGTAAIPVERIRRGGRAFHGSRRDFFEFLGFRVSRNYSAEVQSCSWEGCQGCGEQQRHTAGCGGALERYGRPEVSTNQSCQPLAKVREGTLGERTGSSGNAGKVEGTVTGRLDVICVKLLF